MKSIYNKKSSLNILYLSTGDSDVISREEIVEAVKLVKGIRGIGRPKMRWGYVIESDMMRMNVSKEDEGDLVKWKVRTREADTK